MSYHTIAVVLFWELQAGLGISLFMAWFVNG